MYSEEAMLMKQIDYPKGSQPMGDLKGKVLLFVNVASKCGECLAIHHSLLTFSGLTPQYMTLQALHDKYESKGLQIIGFPSNQVRDGGVPHQY